MYKVCPHCNTRNLEIAKYCFSCEQTFEEASKPKKSIKSSARPSARQTFVSTEIEDDPDTMEIQNDLLGVVKVEIGERSPGVRFKDVVGTDPGGGRAKLGKRTGDKRTGLKILQQDGGNTRRK